MSIPKRLIVLLALIGGAALLAWGYPTLYGDTGLVLVPTADSIPVSGFQLAGDAVRMTTDAGDTVTILPVRLTYGNPGSELFLLYGSSSDTGGFTISGGGMKISLPENLETFLPGLGLGGRITRVKDSSTTTTQVYGVMSKTLLAQGISLFRGANLRIHGGVAFTRFSTSGTDTDFSDYFVGVSVQTPAGDSLAVDYLPELSQSGQVFRKSSVSAAVRVRFSDCLWAEVGATRAFTLGDNNALMVGFMYQVGQ